MNRRRGLWVALAVLLLAVGVTVAIATGGGNEVEPSLQAEAPAPRAGGGSQGQGNPKPQKEDTPEPEASAEASRAALVPADEVKRIDPPPPLEGGDDSIETFGGEASPEDSDAIASALAGYLSARVKGNWEGACALMSSSFEEELGQLPGEASTDDTDAPGLDCPTFLRSTAGSVAKRTLRRLARVRLARVRTEGDRAFAIYKSGYPHWVFMPMVREEAGWRVGALDASPLR